LGAALGLDSEAAPRNEVDEVRSMTGRDWREEESWYLEDERVKLAKRSRTAFEEWLTDLRPWNVRQTLTFSGLLDGGEWLPSEAAAVRRAAVYLRGLTPALGQPVDGFAATEYGTKYGRIHLELVLHVPTPYVGCQVDASTSWEEREGNGHAKTSTVRDIGRAVRYAVKYATKQRGVWVLSLGECTEKRGRTEENRYGKRGQSAIGSTRWRPGDGGDSGPSRELERASAGVLRHERT